MIHFNSYFKIVLKKNERLAMLRLLTYLKENIYFNKYNLYRNIKCFPRNIVKTNVRYYMI